MSESKKPANYDAGKAMRSKVLGADYVSRSVSNPDDFAAPLQDVVTSHAWGTVWTREGLPPKLRSLATVSMLIALNRPNELKLHMRGALNNGITPDELRELIIHASVYCGFPAAMDSMKHAKALFEELGLMGSDGVMKD
ncbi:MULTISPECIES: carboxymuconolactone decarboxylase family protein [Limnobacter]|uniref:4-carboxymuconolactone decarboxylase n=1 Tax=Limnobacter litoralis TaxID=481366 RepID=A0ABQ5YQP3_9BURK|nr:MULTISPECIES: carboxymuconolactone decarboxylase family protein [Limnobacter]GLR26429.1 4-carboxymuconolactone decarboxylase [Limnobacter litoralis]HEX5485864.1 carboxymuconolactone decarboxylase family protein [Limnobacter sp.]